MPLAIITRAKPANPERDRPTLSPEKGREVVGLVLVGIALLLVLSLGTYHPFDRSLFHTSTFAGASGDSPTRPHNLIGPLGAEAAAAGFEFLGLTCLLIPLFLLVAGWRRLRRKDAKRVVGRGVGVGLLLVATPGLLQLGAGRIPWREGSVHAGGAFGVLLSDLLQARLDFVGCVVILMTAVVVGAALAVQSTLGDLLSAWRARLRQTWESWALARERQKERREKERARRRVITKHLQRVAEEKQK